MASSDASTTLFDADQSTTELKVVNSWKETRLPNTKETTGSVCIGLSISPM